jgi:AbrB family looped-hinge helix DNA binding protein
MSSHVGEHMFGTVKVGARGQIVIPKEARDVFDIETGDALLVIGDEERGIAIVKNELFKQFTQEVFSAPERPERDR